MKYFNTESVVHQTFTDDFEDTWFIEEAIGPHQLCVVKVIDGKRSVVRDYMPATRVARFLPELQEIGGKTVVQPLEVRETTRKAKAAQMKRKEEEAKYDQAVEDAYVAYNDSLPTFDTKELEEHKMTYAEFVETKDKEKTAKIINEHCKNLPKSMKKKADIIPFNYANKDEIEVEPEMTDEEVQSYITQIFQQHLHAP